MTTTRTLDVEYQQGIHVTDTVLWLDAPRAADLCFLSHARSLRKESIGPHRKVLLTRATAAMIRPQVGRRRSLVTPFHQRFSLGGLDLELHPSGHMLGAAQIRVHRKGQQLVYTGDFQLAPARTAEPAPVLVCDVLVMRCDSAALPGAFPPREDTAADIARWADGAFRAGQQPVLFAPALGEAQELIQLLSDHRIRLRVHRSIHRLCRKYKSLGVQLPGVHSYRNGTTGNEVILFPLELRTSRAIARLKKTCTALASPHAIEPACAPDWGISEAFPFSMRADYPALLRYARKSGAQRIYLVGKSARTLALRLREQGFGALPLLPPEQMELFESSLATPTGVRHSGSTP